MNNKIFKIREEIACLNEKILKLQDRRDRRQTELTELENTEIIGIVRSLNVGIEELPDLLNKLEKGGVADE